MNVITKAAEASGLGNVVDKLAFWAGRRTKESYKRQTAEVISREDLEAIRDGVRGIRQYPLETRKIMWENAWESDSETMAHYAGPEIISALMRNKDFCQSCGIPYSECTALIIKAGIANAALREDIIYPEPQRAD